MIRWQEKNDCIRLMTMRWDAAGCLLAAMWTIATFMIGVAIFVLLQGVQDRLLIASAVAAGLYVAILGCMIHFRTDLLCGAWLEVGLHGRTIRWGRGTWPRAREWLDAESFIAREGRAACWEVHARLVGGKEVRVLGEWFGTREEVEGLVDRLNELL